MPDVAAQLKVGGLRRPFGLVLAGGLATRLGGGDKGLHLVGGRTIMRRIADRLEDQCEGWAINAPAGGSRLAEVEHRVLPDPIEGRLGPLAGVLAGLQHLTRAGQTDRLLLTVPCDSPFLPPDLAGRLCEARDAAGTATAMAASGGRQHPATAIWPVSVAPLLEETLLSGRGRRVQAFHDRLGVALATWPEGPVDPFFNVNTWEELARADRLTKLFEW